MAEKQHGGAGVLKTSASGVLRRSSSVEILTGITPVQSQLTSPVNTSSCQLSHPTTNGSERPPAAASSVKRVSTPPPVPSEPEQPPAAPSSVTSVSTPPSSAPPSDTKLPGAATTAAYNGGIGVGRQDRAGSVPNSPPPENFGPKVRSPSSPKRKNRLAELKASGKGVLPPLVTSSNKTDGSSPVGTPIIGERGHVFTITTPVTEDVIKTPTKTPSQKVVPCEGDPFDQRRRISAPTLREEKEEDTEPVWQRRLSQLFVPPTENELEPEKEAEETCQLLPQSPSGLHLQKRLSYDSQVLSRSSSGPLHQKRLSSDSSGSLSLQFKRDKNSDRGRSSKRRREGVTEKPQGPGTPKPQPRIIFQDAKKHHQDDQDDEQDEHERSLPELKRVDRGHESDASSSPLATSDEEEAGGDDYTSWDDTICSNRSSYFKMYYTQRGIIGGNRSEDTKSKASHASSHNSLSSLIRERMGKPQPTPPKKTRAEVGLMVLVVVLFIIIVVGITLTSYFYNLHLLELSIFNRIKFYETPRTLEIYDANWSPVTTVHLGSNLPDNSIPEDCTHYLHYLKMHNYSLPQSNDDENYEDMICLDWTGLAQVQLRKLHAQGDVQCYSVWWRASHEDFTLRDCLKADAGHGAWWGGGEMSEGGYPITNANIAPKHMVTGKLGRDSWGQLLRRTWLSERASLLTLPESFHGQVSINYEEDGQLCLVSGPHPSLVAPLPTMKYNLCTAFNLPSLLYFMHQEAVNKRKIVAESAPNLVSHIFEEEKQNVEDTHGHTEILGNTTRILKEVFKDEVKERVEERLEHPVWIPWMPPDRPQLTQDSVIEYADNILKQKFGFWGHILLPPSWQAQPGDLEFDSERFPDPANLSQTLEKKGFRLALTIHPFVSVEAPAFNTGTQEGLWVRQKNSSLPALADYDEEHPSVVTDFSNPRAKQWFSSRLQILQDSYNIDRFHLQPADAHALPVFHEYHLPLPGPDSVLVHFMAAVSTVSPPLSTEGTITPPMPPTFLTLGTADGSWVGLETLVPRILTLAMLGYPLVDIGPIGGIARSGHVPERELYIRWLEAATFLPAMQVSVLPNMYDEEVVNLAFEYMEMRKNMVLPRLHKNVSDALELGTPLINPLALFAPDDPEAAQVYDQWILGEDLLVAPITHKGERMRNVYLPEGIWKDEIDGHLRRGGRWIKNYKVPLTKIPHFTHKSIDEYI